MKLKKRRPFILSLIWLLGLQSFRIPFMFFTIGAHLSRNISHGLTIINYNDFILCTQILFSVYDVHRLNSSVGKYFLQSCHVFKHGISTGLRRQFKRHKGIRYKRRRVDRASSTTIHLLIAKSKNRSIPSMKDKVFKDNWLCKHQSIIASLEAQRATMFSKVPASFSPFSIAGSMFKGYLIFIGERWRKGKGIVWEHSRSRACINYVEVRRKNLSIGYKIRSDTKE